MGEIAGKPEQVPGEVVIAEVSNPLENPACTGKPRPVVLVRRERGHWLVMGLTSKATYRDGVPRVPVPNARAVGLHGPGYLWGSRLTRISVLDLRIHIGWADAALTASLIDQARLDPGDAATLVRSLATRENAA
jgi:hypothetical protein